MAVAASAIAFALHTTAESPLRYSQIPVGLAVAFWSVSFFAGCALQNLIHASLRFNHKLLNMKAGLDPLGGGDPAKIAFGVDTLWSMLDKNHTKSSRWAKWQLNCLIAGAVCYVVWHVLEMWSRTAKSAM